MRQLGAASLVEERRLFVTPAGPVRVPRATHEVRGFGVGRGIERTMGELVQQVATTGDEIAEGRDQ